MLLSTIAGRYPYQTLEECADIFSSLLSRLVLFLTTNKALLTAQITTSIQLRKGPLEWAWFLLCMTASFQLFLPFSLHIHLPWFLGAGLFFSRPICGLSGCFFSPLRILPLPLGVHVPTSSCLIFLIIIVFTFLSPNITECTLVNLHRRAIHQEGS